MRTKKFLLGFCLSFVYGIIFFFGLYALKSSNIIDDAAFVINLLFVGLYQWLYLIPISLYLKRKYKQNKGYIVGGAVITCLNIALWLWIIADPSTFF